MSESQAIRDRIQSILKTQTDAEHSKQSYALCMRFIESETAKKIQWKGRKIGLYKSMPREPSLILLEPWLRQQGTEIFYPAVRDSEEIAMDFYESPREGYGSW